MAKNKAAIFRLAQLLCGCLGFFTADVCIAAPNAVDCLIIPNQIAAIGSPVTGILEQVVVKRGSMVKRGQVVAELSSTVEQATARLAQYKAGQTASLMLAEQKMVFAKQKSERRQAMSAEKLMPQQDSDDAEAEYRLAEAEWMVAKESHEIAQLEYVQQQALLEQKRIHAPFDGVIVEQAAYPGEVVEPGGNSKPIIKLAQLNPLKIQVILPKSRFNTVQPGYKVKVVPESPMAGNYTATVKTVDKLLDAASGSFIVFLELPNPKLTIPAGVKCQATFN